MTGTSVHDVARRLRDAGCRVRWRHEHIEADCPCCVRSRRPRKLNVTNGRLGVVAHCFGGCAIDDVCERLGLTTGDLFPFSRSVDDGMRMSATREPEKYANNDELLALHAEGKLDPAPVDVDYPVRAGRLQRRVLDHFALIHGLRIAASANGSRLRGPIPFASNWVAEALGEDKANVARAIRVLVDKGALGRAGSHRIAPPEDDDEPRRRTVRLYRLEHRVARRDVHAVRHDEQRLVIRLELPARHRVARAVPQLDKAARPEPKLEIRGVDGAQGWLFEHGSDSTASNGVLLGLRE
jgi:hypothetical protein